MSRIGKQPIPIADNVDVVIVGASVSVKGPKGELSMEVHPEIIVEKKGESIIVSPKKDKSSSALWGLTRALVANMVHGVTEGYEKRLEIEGVGYRAHVEGPAPDGAGQGKLVMQLGFSHLIEFPIPENISISVEGNAIDVSGIDKSLVGQAAAKIRAFKKPEPYKGKGIHYKGEHIRRKVGKKAAAA